MKHFTAFVFDSYDIDLGTGEIFLRYRFDDEIRFEEVLRFSPKGIDTRLQSGGESRAPSSREDALGQIRPDRRAALDRAIFYLHLIGGISYFKAFLPPNIVIRSGKLSEKEAAFWDKLYENGLGEFFYRNDIDFRGLINFPYEKGFLQSPYFLGPAVSSSPNEALSSKGAVRGTLSGKSQSSASSRGKTLLPLGGGKDSIVSAELLMRGGHDFDLFTLSDNALFAELSSVLGHDRLSVSRDLSPELFRINREGAYNGHVPVSAYIAFLTVVAAILYDYRYVALSNERSANEGNVEFHGKTVNHQYSKSFEFERDFSDYIREFLTPDVQYFSLLRPFSELSIAKMFSRTPKYFDVFSSCNRNFRIGKVVDLTGGKKLWCGSCPKCAFVFALLSPFIEKNRLVEIFGKNLFAEASLLPTFLQLLGIAEFKPFECVGTKEEITVALYLASEKGEYRDDPVMRYFDERVKSSVSNFEAMKNDAFLPVSEHRIPQIFHDVL